MREGQAVKTVWGTVLGLVQLAGRETSPSSELNFRDADKALRLEENLIRLKVLWINLTWRRNPSFFWTRLFKTVLLEKETRPKRGKQIQFFTLPFRPFFLPLRFPKRSHQSIPQWPPKKYKLPSYPSITKTTLSRSSPS